MVSTQPSGSTNAHQILLECLQLRQALAAESEETRQFHQSKERELTEVIDQVKQIETTIALQEKRKLGECNNDLLTQPSAWLDSTVNQAGTPDPASLKLQLDMLRAWQSEAQPVSQEGAKDGTPEGERSGGTRDDKLTNAHARIRDLEAQLDTARSNATKTATGLKNKRNEYEAERRVELLEKHKQHHQQARESLGKGESEHKNGKRPSSHLETQSPESRGTASKRQHLSRSNPSHSTRKSEEQQRHPSATLRPAARDEDLVGDLDSGGYLAEDGDVTSTSDGATVHIDTLLSEYCFYRHSDRSRQQLDGLLDAVQDALAGKLAPFTDLRFYASLHSLVQKERKCALMRAQKRPDNYPSRMSSVISAWRSACRA